MTPRRRSIGFTTRLALTTSAVVLLACVTLAWLLVRRDLAQTRESLVARGRTIARALAREAELPVLSNDARAMRHAARLSRLQDDVVYVGFFDATGRPLVHVGHHRRLRGHFAPPMASTEPLAVGDDLLEFWTSVETTDTSRQPEELAILGETDPTAARRVTVGRVSVGVSLEGVHRHRAELVLTAAVFTLGVTIWATILAVLVAAAVTRPLAKLAAATDRIARGELATVDVRDGAEIGRLADSFNAMVDSLAQSRAAVEEYQHTLEEKVAARTERLELMNRELEEAGRLKSEFLATVSHELRTPFNVTLGTLEMLSDPATGVLSPSQRELVETIHRYSLQQLELVTNVLDFSRLASGQVSVQLARVDLRASLQDVCDLHVGRHGGTGLPIRLDVARDVPELVTDRIKVQEIVRNLLDNAVKFTREGEIVIRARRIGPRVRIEVQDTGCGIAAAELPHVFEEFRQVGDDSQRRTGGVGLGLTIVKRLTYALGGTIVVHSEPGVGTTFVVDLPIENTTRANVVAAA